MPRLMLLASCRLARRGRAPTMAEAEDFVHDAITKTMAGVRLWNRRACTLFEHLAGVIVSDISHSSAALERRVIARPNGHANGHTTWPPEVAEPAPNQEEATVLGSDRRRLLDHLRAIDPLLADMAERMLVHDLWETRELGDALGISASEVANLRKRLKRALRAFLMETRP
jgi:DNA-directed RNA polymerase specialized sigma24 family protein